MNPTYPARARFAHLPTPIEALPRLSKHLGGPTLYIKRDDQTGLATGGNKSRKLEFLIADALAQGADHLITIGAAQSNHCRQTAAAAAHFGLGCSLILRGEEPAEITGNLLLNKLLGAHIYWAKKEDSQTKLNAVRQELQALGRTPYLIPLGGSNVIGATGYVLAMQELQMQLTEKQLNLDFILFASSSGGTQAGIVLGAEVCQLNTKLLGISVEHTANNLETQVAALATATATHLNLGNLSISNRIEVNDDYLGNGYAQVADPEREAIQLMAQFEGILLDPVYTGRAMAGLIDLIRWGAFTPQQTILFWHTGGTAALSAFSKELL